MREVSEKAALIIEGGSFQHRLKLAAFYGSDVTLPDVPVASWQFGSERGRDIPSIGDVQAVYADEQGTSVTPREFTDALAPFGQEVVAELVVSAGPFSESVVVGRFRIGETPEASDATHRFGSRVITTSSTVKLKLVDGLERVRAYGFTSPTRPGSSSCWAELARLTEMQVVRSVPDQSMPSIEYELAQEGRLNACQAIASKLGGTLYVRPDGALTVIPDSSGVVVKRIRLDDDGLRLSEISRALSTDQLYNEVVGIFADKDRNPIVVPPAQITEGPMSVHGPLGHRTRYYASDFVDSPGEARAAVAKILAGSSTAKTVTVPVSIVLDPRLEVGDTVELEQDRETLTGTIEALDMKSDGTMDLDIAVTGSVPEMNLGRPNAFA